jgi:hypothetical protein
MIFYTNLASILSSPLKQFCNGTLERVAELFQRIESDILLTQFESMQCRIRNAFFA